MRDSHVRESISKLKEDIVARAALSRAMAAEARALRGDERHRKHLERRAFGRCTRWRLLAYTWLRGHPYARAEPRAVVPAAPWAIQRALDAVGMASDVGAVRRWLRDELADGAATAASAQREDGPSCAASSTS